MSPPINMFTASIRSTGTNVDLSKTVETFPNVESENEGHHIPIWEGRGATSAGKDTLGSAES